MISFLGLFICSIMVSLILSIIQAVLVSPPPAKEKLAAGLDSTTKPTRDPEVKAAETAKKEDRASKNKKRRSKNVPVVVEVFEEPSTQKPLQEFPTELPRSPKIQPKEVDLIDEGVVNYAEIGRDSMNDEVGIAESLERDDGLLEEEEDDWEGVESTELERVFGAATLFVGSRDNADKMSSLGRDVNLQLYGLHKIAIEGPCHVPQPMALNLSARAKWNSWRQLGDMSPEVAMELYISVLSSSIPGWMGEDCRDLSLQNPQCALDKLSISHAKDIGATQETLKEEDELQFSAN